MKRQLSLFEDQRLDLEGAIELSLASLREYGQRYRHWAVAYSGGKDSTATVTLVAWAIRAGLVPKPDNLTVLYADTRQEYPPLQGTAERLMAHLQEDGIEARAVMAEMETRFYVYILGRGVPPPTNRFRWCTEKIKVKPMNDALSSLDFGEKFLLINGVRLGESAARDQRIAISCSTNSGECGQGWFQAQPPASAGDTLAPLLHWRTCHVFDWVYFEDARHGYPEAADIAAVYGDEDVRTGCIGCNLVTRDVPLERLVRKPAWEHLRPLLEINPLLQELRKAKYRKRKYQIGGKREGQLGPLTMEARAYGLRRVLDIQGRAGVDLINSEEESAIRQMWSDDIWPNGWGGDEIDGSQPIDLIDPDSGMMQALLVR